MSRSKLNSNEIITSRITTTFMIYALLSLLAWVYVLPFSKTYLVINDYHRYIELAAIILTSVFAVLTIVNFFLSKNKK